MILGQRKSKQEWDDILGYIKMNPNEKLSLVSKKFNTTVATIKKRLSKDTYESGETNKIWQEHEEDILEAWIRIREAAIESLNTQTQEGTIKRTELSALIDILEKIDKGMRKVYKKPEKYSESSEESVLPFFIFVSENEFKDI